MKLLSSLSPLVVCGAFAAAALVASATAEPAFAEPQTEDFAFKFSYNPADLQDAAKAEKVLVRLERAVRRHCDADTARTVQERSYAKSCVQKTMSDSMDKFGSRMLTQAYESRAAG